MSEVLQWFGDAGHAAFIASLLSIIAIIVSIFAFRKSHKTHNRLVDIEEAREKDRLVEKQKANLIARIDHEPGSHGMKDLLVIENTGVGGAKNVEVMLDGTPMFEHPSMCLQKDSKFGEVGPTSAARFLLFTADQLRPPNRITITWEDDSGEPGKYSTTLTL